MSPEEKQAHHLGPGGYKCPCCGPSPKKRAKHRRLIRRRLKHIFNRIFKSEMNQKD